MNALRRCCSLRPIRSSAAAHGNLGAPVGRLLRRPPFGACLANASAAAPAGARAASGHAAGRARAGDDVEVWGQFATTESGETYSLDGDDDAFGCARVRGKLHQMGTSKAGESAHTTDVERFVDVYAQELFQPGSKSGRRRLLSGRLLRVQGANVKVRRRLADASTSSAERDGKGGGAVQALLRHRVHIGCHHSHTHPKFFPFLFGRRNGIDIIDLEHSARCLRRSLAFLRVLSRSGGKIVFLATERPYTELAPMFLDKCGHTVLTRPFPRGQLTNPITQDPNALPDLIVSFAPESDAMNLAEAASIDVITMGLCDSNADPNLLTYPIPGNGTNAASAFLFCSLFAHALEGARPPGDG